MRHVLIDANNYMMIAMYGAKKKGPVETTLKPLLLSMIWKMQRILKESSYYYALWDSKGSTAWRKEQSPEYKADREYDDDLFEATRLAKEVFDECMIPQFEYEGAEADDLIHALAENMYDRTNNVIIVTRDNDLIQAVQHGFATAVWDPFTKKNKIIPSYDIVVYKCLTGDPGDNIKGVPGIGPKKALKLIQEGVDFSLIEKDYQIIHIPSHPKYQEFLEATKPFAKAYEKI
jgi:DNA polymerase-1